VSRCAVLVRDAGPDDAAALVAVWGEVRRPGAERSEDQTTAEATQAVARIAADPDQRLLVAVRDDAVVGASHLVRSAVSPISTECAVHVTHLQVMPAHRRLGIGKALIEAAVAWAEEKDTAHLLIAAASQSREANRFLARLGLTQVAVVRGAAIPALRGRLPVEPPAGARVNGRNHRSVGQVLAQRRMQRRALEKLG
jgi:GNAT superfamily N-acetyltransferase